MFSHREYYESGAFMLEEEATVISGLLVGLNVIDVNLGIKDEDLDQPVSIPTWYTFTTLSIPIH